MPTYSRLTINLSPNEEKQIKQMAKEQGKSISAYCRETLLGGVEQPLNRVTIEYQIDKMKEEIRMMNDNILFLTKELLRQSKLNGELSNAFILLALNGDEDKQLEVYETADKKADKYVNDMFEG